MLATNIMNEILLKNFEELQKTLKRYQIYSEGRGPWIFRGQSDFSWALLPKVGRPEYKGIDDLNMFDEWKRKAVAYHDNLPTNDYDCLAVAQHHGLATRLLDWSFNPLVAAFFAVYEQRGIGSAIYCYRPTKQINKDKKMIENKDVLPLKPTAAVSRIVQQGGLFTYHGQPNVSLDKALLEGDELDKLIIDSAFEESLLLDLNFYGINKLSLFPDLDGLSEYENWYRRIR